MKLCNDNNPTLDGYDDLKRVHLSGSGGALSASLPCSFSDIMIISYYYGKITRIQNKINENRYVRMKVFFMMILN